MALFLIGWQEPEDLDILELAVFIFKNMFGNCLVKMKVPDGELAALTTRRATGQKPFFFFPVAGFNGVVFVQFDGQKRNVR